MFFKNVSITQVNKARKNMIIFDKWKQTRVSMHSKNVKWIQTDPKTHWNQSLIIPRNELSEVQNTPKHFT